MSRLPTLFPHRPIPHLLGLALALSVPAQATDLSLYPGFAEVREDAVLPASNGTATFTRNFTRGTWNLIQPNSLSFVGAPLVRIRVRPTDLDWLTTQQGQPVKVLRAGQPAVSGTLIRADDLLVRLKSGEYLHPGLDELAFAAPPPRDWRQGGIAARFEVTAGAKVSGQVSYRTGALAWSPRYELGASAAGARLVALAQIRNLSQETFDARKVDLFAGEVRNDFTIVGQGVIATSALPGMAKLTGAGTAETTANRAVADSPVSSLGEVRGLQRYALKGGLKLGRGELLTVPFVQPQIKDFTRYDSITTYFDPQERQGRASRHYKFTPDQSLPAGSVSVREEGSLIGTVTMPAAQAARSVDLNLGADNELRYTRSVKRLSQEKNPAGKIVSVTYQVTYALVSTKTRPVRVQLREQTYARFAVVDGKPVPGQQVVIDRRVDVPAGGQASLTFKLKLGMG